MRRISPRQLWDDERLVRIARIYIILAFPVVVLKLISEVARNWQYGIGHPFGQDFINFWSAARLSQSGDWRAIYDLERFHQFQLTLVGSEFNLYHYSYPPVTWLVTAPLGLLPYPAAWVAWQLLGWAAFALALRRIAGPRWLLISFAAPAVMVNGISGQNGAWFAAAIGWGLILLKRRPYLAGAILAVFVVKPQLGWLIPVALLAAGERRALIAFVGTAVALLGATVIIFGMDPWLDYLRQAAFLKEVVLEDAADLSSRMLSMFIAARHAGLSVPAAYVVQAIWSAAVAAFVAVQWRRSGSTSETNALLILGLLASSLYVSDYDCVMAVLAVCWLWPRASDRQRLALAAIIVAPLFTAPLAFYTKMALAAPAVWIAFYAATRMQPVKPAAQPPQLSA